MNEAHESEASDAGAIEYPALFLKRGEDARLRAGHAWVFSNEIDTAKSPLAEFTPGETVVVVDHAGKPLGLACVNPNVLIAARLVARGLKHPFDRSLMVHRLKVALGLRERIHSEPHYRLVHGEADGLPGLVLDRYGDVLVGQIGTLAMEQRRADIEHAIIKVLKPRALVWKNRGGFRALEDLPEYVEVAHGELPDLVQAHEGGLHFGFDPLEGQKTGYFWDQRANRDLLAPYARGARVLDVFSYVGAWGLRAAAAGASDVLCVDASRDALNWVERNAADNGLAERVKTHCGDAFDVLKELRQQRERFDVVIVDPPAFAKRRKDFAEAKLAYRRINEAAMQLLGRDGILVSCSCSWHMPRAALTDVVNQGARHLDRQVQILAQLQQSPDHPVVPAIPETDYLKGLIARVLMP